MSSTRNIKELNEEQLSLVKNVKRDGCKRSYRELLAQYEPLIKSQSQKIKNIYKETPMELEDIENMTRFFFYKQTIKYDTESPKTFPTYIKEFLNYSLLNWIRKYTTKKHSVLNYVSVFDEDDEDVELVIDPELKKEIRILQLRNSVSLGNLEAEVLDAAINGEEMIDVANRLKKSVKTIYAARARAINKIKNKEKNKKED